VSDEFVIDNSLGMDGIRRVHVMSNSPIPCLSPKYGDGVVSQEAGAWHFRIESPMRGLIHLKLEGGSERLAVLWCLAGYPNVRTAIKDAWTYFQEHSGLQADYAYMAMLPKGVENGFEVADMMIFEAEWMIPGYVLVCSAQHYPDEV
jgi:hypothetical protein